MPFAQGRHGVAVADEACAGSGFMSSPARRAWSGLNGWAIFCGLALAFYVVGLSYVARRESFRGAVPYWPLWLLATPIVLAMLMNTGEFAEASHPGFDRFLVLWMARCVRTIFRPGETNVGRIVSGLLAGIVFVDWLAVAPQISHTASTIVFVALFGLTELLQKFVPAHLESLFFLLGENPPPKSL